MPLNILLVSFVIGAAIVTRLPVLPAAGMILLLACAGTCGLAFPRARWLAALCLGFSFAAWHSVAILEQRLPYRLEGKALELQGTVVSLPQEQQGLVRFRLSLDPGLDAWGAALINLTLYQRAGERISIRPGQKLRVTAHLNRPHGSVNPGLFDYEGWLLAQEIAATGYVTADSVRVISDSPLRAPHHRLRFWLRERLQRSLPDTTEIGLLIALSVGESAQISTRQWQTLSDTGTNHLLIISGLHIGLVAAASYRLFLAIAARFLRHSRQWAGWLSLGTACFYGAIAGLGLPVQRALVMAAVALSGTLLRRNIPLRSMFCAALFMVTLIDPLAPLSTGFWLSFGAVFSLLYAFAGRQEYASAGPVRWLLAGVKTQWAVYVGMMPLLLHLVFQVSLAAFFVNLVAIPWIGVLVIPPLLLAIPLFAVNDAAGGWFAHLAGDALAGLWGLLEAGAAGRWVIYGNDTGVAALCLGLMAALVILAPRGVVPRWLGLLLALPMFAAAPRPPPGGIDIDVLDVGQGLSVIARSTHRTLLYDAGPRFGDRFDAGERIVTPLLRRGGDARTLDMFVVSHGDNDHAGGAPAIFDDFLVPAAYASEPGSLPAAGCASTQDMVDGEVRFTLLPAANAVLNNDRSCIVLIQGRDFAMLLPGDIEWAGERHLLGIRLPDIEVLLAPHHGSRSSSSPAFLNHVHPRAVVFSTGYRNRFSHPDPAIVDRYVRRGILTWNTAVDGAVRIRYRPGNGFTVATARRAAPRFWYDPLP